MGTDNMTPTRSQLLALSEKASPGEWTHSVEDHDIGRGMVTRRSVVVGGDGENIIRLGYPSVDCEFIAACVNEIRRQLNEGEKCDWQSDFDGNWSTDCGHLYTIIEGSPHENEMAFCCFCGKPTTESRAPDDDDAALPAQHQGERSE